MSILFLGHHVNQQFLQSAQYDQHALRWPFDLPGWPWKCPCMALGGGGNCRKAGANWKRHQKGQRSIQPAWSKLIMSSAKFYFQWLHVTFCLSVHLSIMSFWSFVWLDYLLNNSCLATHLLSVIGKFGPILS